MGKTFLCIVCGRHLPESSREFENTDWCVKCVEVERLHHHEKCYTGRGAFYTDIPNYAKYPLQIPQDVKEEILAFRGRM